MSNTQLDPTKYEVLYNRLEQALIEAKEVIKQLSASVIVRDAGEVCQGFLLPNGDSVLLATGLLNHLFTIARCVKFMNENNYREEIGINDGDQFINNDAHIGGMHMPDFEVMAPVYYKGELVGWTGNFTHVGEVGAIEPGGMCSAARETYHEGIKMPCVKIVDQYRIKTDLFRMMRLAVRNPKPIDIDTRAKISGNERARQKIVEIIEEFGVDFFKAATQEYVKDAEKEAETLVKQFRPGIYRSRCFTDTTGLEQKLDSIEMEVEVTEDGMLKISAPVAPRQRVGMNNNSFPASEGVLFGILLNFVFHRSRWNGGTGKRVELSLPSGSALNAERNAAIAYGCVGIGAQLMISVNDVFSKIFFVSKKPEEIMAPCGNVMSCHYFGAIDQFGRLGGAMAMDCFVAPGGARFDRDGLESGAFEYNPWSEVPDIEAEEMDGPVMYLGRGYIPDSSGYGKFRGGSCPAAVIMVHNAKFMQQGSFGSGNKVAGIQGLWGGYPTPGTTTRRLLNSDFYERANGKMIPHTIQDLDDGTLISGELMKLEPTVPTRIMANGDIYAHNQWGGAGLGDPIERDPALVLKDVLDSFVSIEKAKQMYCVSIETAPLRVNEAETKALRDGKRRERIAKGIPAKKFVKTMVKRRQERDLPGVVLNYLDEMSGFSEDFKSQLKFEETIAQEA